MADYANIPDVAIIGAGVIGCSIAFHLARLGCTNCLLYTSDAADE